MNILYILTIGVTLVGQPIMPCIINQLNPIREENEPWPLA